MPVYTYVVTNNNNQAEKGTIASDSPRQARQMLRDRGLTVVELALQKSAKSWSGLLPFGKKQEAHTAAFVSELSTLLAVGVPLLEALDTLIAQQNSRFKNCLLHLRDQVQSGVSLADAMKQHPEVFDRLCVSMTGVGEKTGALDETLRQLATFKQRSLLFKDRILSALMYPLIILSVSVGVSIFLMTVVIPMLLTNLVEAGQTLPWPTKILKAASDFLLAYGWLVAILLAVLSIVFFLALRTRNGKRAWDKLFLKIPLLGNLSRKQEIAKLSLMISALLKSGIEFVKAVEIAQGTTKNVLLDEALEDCKQLVSRGKDIGHAVGQHEYFPPLVAQIFTIGQKSGRLDEMLERLAEDYDHQVESATTRLTATIEPVLIVTLSIFVGFILFATVLPIMESANALNSNG